jgi:hypothetical protein
MKMRFFTPSALARSWRYRLACAGTPSTIVKQYITAAASAAKPALNAGRQSSSSNRRLAPLAV